MKRGRNLACIVMALVLLHQTSALAEDGLYLCGIVKEVDNLNAIIVVDVVSESCHGTHMFKVNEKEIPSFIVDERKCFSIDQNTCHPGYTASIVEQE